IALFATVIVCSATLCAGTFIHHKLTVTIDPPKHSFKATDQITIPAAQAKKKMSFLLNMNMTVESQTPGVSVTLDKSGVTAEDFGMDREDFKLPDYVQNKYVLAFSVEPKSDAVVTLAYGGVINYEIKQLGEEYARGFSQTPGIIGEKGVYLAGSTYWVPWFNDAWINFELTTSVASPWDVVSQGKRTLNETKNGIHTVRWDSPEPMEEVYLIAATFTEYATSAGATDVMAYLRTPDETLANKYLETTAQYLEMYRQLVGPYPFTKFALVENFWETGYGMPSFTLLGEQIIRFPFILHSSYPHELLHNYWGNSAYVDFKTGNWCEGITAYMADHLIAEQRGQGDEYRRTTLQKFTDYVTPANDFPLKKFLSRTNPSSEAIGYGKSMMMWNMLRDIVGDEQFVKSFQKFYRDNKFKAASFDDIRVAFEAVSGKDLKQFFTQWVDRTGAPELSLSKVSVKKENAAFNLSFALTQVQKDDAFAVDVPIAVTSEKGTEVRKVAMTQKSQNFNLTFTGNPVLIQVDPQFSIFRKLHYSEIPPSLSKILGAEDIVILLPSKADEEKQAYYKDLANTWAADSTKKIAIKFDNEIATLPAKQCVWIFGMENMFAAAVKDGIKDYDAEMTAASVRLAKTSYKSEANSFVISARHPKSPSSVLVLLTADSKDAAAGLARKLPHYGKYSYLVFEGKEPTNIGKGEWGSVNSPLMAKLLPAVAVSSDVPRRKALAMLAPVFSADRMMKSVNYLAGEELAGRAPGTPGIEKAANFIAEKFKNAGLLPGADDGSYFQVWDEVVDAKGTRAPVKNIIGTIPGTNPKYSDESVIICAHYDHLGLGWPGGNTGNIGKIHYGADDNASGVAVMMELADLLGKSLKPQRTVIFVAFSCEEEGLLGSKTYIKTMKKFPAKKAIGVLNLDGVGRLNDRKLLVLSSSSAREWKFIFMGAGYVTGVEAEMVTQDLDASDQRSFIEIGVPGVQFFAGAHEDYHKPSDTPDKIDGAGMVKVATFVREGLLYLGDRETPLAFQGQVTAEAKKPQAAGERRVTTGSMPDFAFSGPGVRIADLSNDSPAAKAGLQKGDVIIKIGDRAVAALRDYSDALKSYQPGDVVEFTYLREGKENKAKVELIAK
ncbi:MAG: M28 family peptidase, partial [Ignavibacteriales bacterium]|nr:M28 family peptidase [Ignavibacteriales bacterium]